MPDFYEGDNYFSAQELADALGEGEQTTPAAETQQPQEQAEVPTTKAVSERINKARADEREKLAKEFGYDSYAEMQKYKTNKALRDEGLDPDKVSPIIDKLVDERFNSDPRVQELDNYRMEQFANSQLKELSKLVGQEFTSLEQVPADVLEDWGGNRSKGVKPSGATLKQSYLKLHGEELLAKSRHTDAQGSTTQMQSPKGATTGVAPKQQRHLTEHEEMIYRRMHPDWSEERIKNKMVDF